MVKRYANHVETLRNVHALYRAKNGPDWLPEDATEALLTCIAMGPWQWKRRRKVADDALAWYKQHGGEGLTSMPLEEPYPLEWQNNMLQAGIKSSGERVCFEVDCVTWRLADERGRPWRETMESILRYFGWRAGNGPKVIWLFARDFLMVPSFPIDRHVARNCRQLDLPPSPWSMVELCLKAGLDAGEMGRLFFCPVEREVSL